MEQQGTKTKLDNLRVLVPLYLIQTILIF